MWQPQACRRALIIIPGTTNYFYNQCGQRLAETLRDLGVAVDVSVLERCPESNYDYCFLSNISEIIYASGAVDPGVAKLRALRQRCRYLGSCAIDCVQTRWYRRIHELSVCSEVDAILDLGVRDQSSFLEPTRRSLYRFVFSGLTPTEKRLLDAADWDDTGRSIPWAFVGHNTPYRVALVDHLIQTVSPQGFVYIPEPAAYTEKGSPHLNQQQFENVLRHTRYQVWCSHHSHFYMEPERFRLSLLTGGVPIRVVSSRQEMPPAVPFPYLLLEWRELGEHLTVWAFSRLRERLRQDWQTFPLLAEELAHLLQIPGHTQVREPAA
jgi:hypothetical protein